MSDRHRVLTIAWMVTIASILIAVVVLPVLAGVLYYVTLGLAIVTYRRAAKTPHELMRVRWYRAIFGLLFLLASTVVVGAGSSVFVDPKTGNQYFVFVLLAATNVLVAIFAWRALVQPEPRRAALAGGIATVFELLALIGDALISAHLHGAAVWGNSVPVVVTVIAAMVAAIVGMLGCVFALTLFRPAPTTMLPQARVTSLDSNGKANDGTLS